MTDSNNRRDFLYYATAGAAAVGVGGAVAALGRSLGPSADQIYANTLQIDFETLQEGQQITIVHHGSPLFLRYRTQAEIDHARATHLDDLMDPINRYGIGTVVASGEPATDQSRSIDLDGRYVIYVGICTHLGCVPIGDRAGDFDGWFCPCHAAHFDAAGRVRKGPAPYNLAIPSYEWDGGTILTILDDGRLPPMNEERLDQLLYGNS